MLCDYWALEFFPKGPGQTVACMVIVLSYVVNLDSTILVGSFIYGARIIVLYILPQPVKKVPGKFLIYRLLIPI